MVIWKGRLNLKSVVESKFEIIDCKWFVCHFVKRCVETSKPQLEGFPPRVFCLKDFEGNELSKQQSNYWPTEAAAIGTNKKLSIKRIPSTVTKIRPEPISATERADNAKRYGGRENNRTVEISWDEVTERANIFVPPSPPPLHAFAKINSHNPNNPNVKKRSIPF